MWLRIAVLALGAALTCACAAPKRIMPKLVVYSFSEPDGDKVDVTLAIIKPGYSGQLARMAAHGKTGCVAEFADGFKKSLYDMMVAKGMNTRGPFDDIDEMTFPDKKGSDLVIAPEFDFVVQKTESQPATAGWSSVTYYFRFSMGGTLVLSVVEPLSKERMWFKKIELPSVDRDLKIVTDSGVAGLPSIDNALENACRETLLAFFNTAMPKVSRYLSAEEMLMLKGQAQELRAAKRY